MLLKPRHILGIDFETASHADIKVGSAAYANHPTTRVLCATFTFHGPDKHGAKVRRRYDWRPGQKLPYAVLNWINNGYPVLAHNASFEFEIIKAGLVEGLPLPKFEQWHDTMAMAAAINLPQGLEALTTTLGVAKKDMEGHNLMLKMCKLDANGEHVNKCTEEDHVRLGVYCGVDVDVMLDAYDVLPGMTAAERETWVADFEMAARGVAIDLRFVEAMVDLTKRHKTELTIKSQEATADLGADMVIDASNDVKRYLKACGIPLPRKRKADGWVESLDAESCQRLLDDTPDLPQHVLDVVKRKVELGRLTSLSKLKAVDKFRAPDNRVKWQLRFCGASQTGRWSAKGLQLHNVPKDRRKRGHSLMVRELIGAQNLKLLQQCEPNVLEALSLCLRSMIVAPEGRDLIGADYAAIEARVLPWLAFDEAKLDIFRQGIDIYVKSAALVGSLVRNLGKVQELALQFGMGVIKFRDTAADYGVDLDLKEAYRVQRSWRDRNPKTVDFWAELEMVARELILKTKGNHSAPVGRCIVRRVPDRLLIELPSGRHLNYWSPRIVPTVKRIPSVNEEGEEITIEMEVDAIQFFGPRGKAMVLKETYGGKLAENVTQATARDLLAHALPIVRAHPVYDLVIHLHDAACAEVDAGAGDPEEFSSLITQLPSWAEGLPVDAEGYRSPYFIG